MHFTRRSFAAFAIAIGLALPALAPVKAAAADEITVFAAASMKNALDDVAKAWEAAGHGAVKVSYAASSALAKQIEEGAPADIFISADLAWMDHVEKAGAIDPATRSNLLGNRIVLIAAAEEAKPVDIAHGFDLVGLIGDGRLAMGNVEAVPAGKYGKAALEMLGIWNSVADKLAQAENVRVALKYVATGEAPYGIVYQTDAASDPDVKIAGTFPEASHPPIIYPVALLKASQSPKAAAFLAFLTSDKARPLFEKQGFTVLAPQSN